MKKFALSLLLTLAAVFGVSAQVDVQTLLSGATVTGTGTIVKTAKNGKTFQASGQTSSGSGSATIVIQGSVNCTNFDTIGTITLTLGTTTTSDSFTSDDRYACHRPNVTAISGTGASVSVFVGY